jgi:hypothetical protein
MSGRYPGGSPSPRDADARTAGQGNFPVYGFQGVALATADPVKGGPRRVPAKVLNPPDKKTPCPAVLNAAAGGEGHVPGGEC